jgi:hypothetical protein
MTRIRCPSCKTVFQPADARQGAVTPCPSCGQRCRVPAPAGSPQPSRGSESVRPAPRPQPPPPPDDEVEELEEVEESDLDEHLTDRPAERPAAADDDEAVQLEVVRPGRRRKKKRGMRRRDEDYGKVNLGLGFYYAGILALIAAIVVELIAFGAAMTAGINAVAGEGKGAMAGAGAAMVLGFIAGILIDWVAPILSVIGSILCLWVPASSGARGLCIASMALNAGALFLGLIAWLAMFFVSGEAGEWIRLLGLIPAFLMTFIGWCLFMGFLRALNLHLGEETLADEATAVLFRGIVILVATPFAFLVGIGLIAALRCFGLIMLLVAVLFGLYGLFLFLKRQLDLIASMRQVIASRY